MEKVINLFGDTYNKSNSKYSDIIDEFMSSFRGDLVDFYDIEDMLDFVLSAWNMGNLSNILPKQEFKDFLKNIPEIQMDNRLFKKMLAHKIKHFKENNHFVLSIKMEESTGGPKLIVDTQSEEDFMSHLLFGVENEFSPSDFDDNYINRNAIVIRPLQPFIDWLNSINTVSEEEPVKESNVYLIADEVYDVEDWLKRKYDQFFKMELEEWHTNKKQWPKKRSYKMFKQWFNIEFSTMVYDMEKEPVIKME